MKLRIMDEAKDRKAAIEELQDALVELIKNNSSIEGEPDDSVALPNVVGVRKAGRDRIFIDMEDGTRAFLAFRILVN